MDLPTDLSKRRTAAFHRFRRATGMIDIAVKKSNERVLVVRYFGWGIFDPFGKARHIKGVSSFPNPPASF